MKKLVSIILFICLSFWVDAQNVEKNLDQDFVYSREWRVGAKIHTNGFGISMAKSKILDRHKKNVWQFELQEIRHAKQYRQLSTIPSANNNARSYYYGKQNNFFNLNINFVRHKVIAEKGRKNGIEIAMHYGLGLSVGLLKPYYLNVDISDSDRTHSDIKYNPDPDDGNAHLFLTDFRIYGASSFIVGIDEIKLHPGLQFQYGFVFDWAGAGEVIKAVDVGLVVNAYYKKVPIMINTDNNIIFTNVYGRVVFGRKSID